MLFSELTTQSDAHGKRKSQDHGLGNILVCRLGINFWVNDDYSFVVFFFIAFLDKFTLNFLTSHLFFDILLRAGFDVKSRHVSVLILLEISFIWNRSSISYGVRIRHFRRASDSFDLSRVKLPFVWRHDRVVLLAVTGRSEVKDNVPLVNICLHLSQFSMLSQTWISKIIRCEFKVLRALNNWLIVDIQVDLRVI